jgi:hypothetical protein
LFVNRGNVEYHMEHYQAAARDYQTADEIDPSCGCGEALRRIEERMDFTRTAFQRAVDIDSRRGS